ncbi:hypothetical protein, partial [uncultured Duncaniella sp.]|uniref:hypothetical protein n=1 Tax=uncultured Duncaniella sp. TaxID=2768039 RepID=UPI0025A9915F
IVYQCDTAMPAQKLPNCWKISAYQNNSENKSSVGSVSGLAKAEQPQILPNHCNKSRQLFVYLCTNSFN